MLAHSHSASNTLPECYKNKSIHLTSNLCTVDPFLTDEETECKGKTSHLCKSIQVVCQWTVTGDQASKLQQRWECLLTARYWGRCFLTCQHLPCISLLSAEDTEDRVKGQTTSRWWNQDWREAIWLQIWELLHWPLPFLMESPLPHTILVISECYMPVLTSICEGIRDKWV